MILKLTWWFKTLLSITQNTFMLSSSKPASRILNNFMLYGSKNYFPEFKTIYVTCFKKLLSKMENKFMLI